MADSSKEKKWVGTSLDEIYGKCGPWNYITDPVTPSRHHHVLYTLETVDLESPPKPFCSLKKMKWGSDNVRMPFSEDNLFPVKNEDGTEALKSRWEIIQTSLLQPINNSRELEALISTYNTRLPKLEALHYFFEEVMQEEESENFFKNVLPGIINLALQLPFYLQKNIPLLKQGIEKSISLSQQQIASLLANGFLCTFPWRKDMIPSYPIFNFVRLFSSHQKPKRESAIMNKLKCICHYFKRVLSKNPVGVVTFEKKSLSSHAFPRWDKQTNNLGNTRVHICCEENIEDANGLLQVDFANKFVGGGVLGYGCVQEEIRYIICPELIVSRLFTECLSQNEALLITGAERYNSYKGYGDTFEWTGNFEDSTPYDQYGRRRISVVAIDATRFNKPSDQYTSSLILRELNKAYVGFYSRIDKVLPAVATGNWGCGAFKGNPYLKSLIQLAACSVAKRDMVYYTFGDTNLRDSIYNMYTFIASNQISTEQLWRYICGFSLSKLTGDNLFAYIQQAHFDVKKQKSMLDFVMKPTNDANDKPTTSSKFYKNNYVSNVDNRGDGASPKPDLSKQGTSTMKNSIVVVEEEVLSDEDVIELSQPDVPLQKTVKKANQKVDSQKLFNLFEKIDGIVEVKESKFAMEIEELDEEKILSEGVDVEEMELDEVVVEKNDEIKGCTRFKKIKPQKKITDFFKMSQNK